MSLTYDAYKLVKKQMHSNPYRVKVNKLIDCFEILLPVGKIRFQERIRSIYMCKMS